MRNTPKRHRSKAPRSSVAPSARGAGARCLLVIMAKQPVMGHVKTRLAAEVGAPEAVRFYRNCLRTIATRLGADPRWRTVLAIAPDTALGNPVWPRGIGRIAQGHGDLGLRMQRLLETPRADRVIVVGTDIPAIRPAAHRPRLPPPRQPRRGLWPGGRRRLLARWPQTQPTRAAPLCRCPLVVA